MGCGHMGGIAQAEHHDRFIIDLQTSGAEAEEVIANRLGRGAEFAVKDGPDGGPRIVGRRFIGWVWVRRRFEASGLGGAVETEHKQAEGDGFAQSSVEMEAAVDFYGWEEDGDRSRGEEDLPEAFDGGGIDFIGFTGIGGGVGG